MRQSWRRGLAVSATAALLLAGCGNGDDEPQDEAGDVEQDQEDALDDLTADDEDLEDPNEDIEDGVYAGNGVLLPVPEGWELDPQAFQQGIVAAFSEDQQSQMTAGAVDTEGQELEFEEMVDSVRQQLENDAEVDEEIDLQGAERAHRLTILGLPPQQEGMPENDVTIILAEDGNGLVGEFAFAAPSGEYDEDLAELLVAEAGFDPDSEPPEMPQMQQQPEGGEMPEDMEEELEELERQMEEEQQDQ